MIPAEFCVCEEEYFEFSTTSHTTHTNTYKWKLLARSLVFILNVLFFTVGRGTQVSF